MTLDGLSADITRGFGLAAEGLKPADRINPRDSFSRLLNDTINRENQSIDVSSHSDRSESPNTVLSASRPIVTATGVIPKDTHIDRTDKLYEQCLALETFLVKNILTAMRKNVMKSSLIDTGFAGEIYEDMLWDEYAKDYTKNAGFGLADLAYLELTGQRGRRL